jgi:hypothetical protein
MNRRRLVENLIYLILTYVQASLVPLWAQASPSIEPTTEAAEVTYPTVDTSGAPRIDSLSISDVNEDRPPIENPDWIESVHDRVSFLGGFYSGPQLDEANKSLLVVGGDYILRKDPSDKIHLGFKVSSTRNPLLFVSRELYLRNYWSFLKSWSPIIQLELDTIQGFSAPVAFNYYSAGAGATFYLYPPVELTLNLIPISSRGISFELLLSYLAF